jgi:hypothetical protein
MHEFREEFILGHYWDYYSSEIGLIYISRTGKMRAECMTLKRR